MTILYFIEGYAPTDKEFKDAEQYMNNGPILQFIALPELDLNGPMLPFSQVKGKVPEQYKPFTEIAEVTTKYKK